VHSLEVALFGVRSASCELRTRGDMAHRVFVVGVGHGEFCYPGQEKMDYPAMANQAVQLALKDANNLDYKEIKEAAVSFVYGDSTSGQTALYEAGLTGIPIVNCNNNCSSGSTALYLARRLVQSGSDCVLALGFEKMPTGGLQKMFDDRRHPAQRHMDSMFQHGIPRERFLEGVASELTESVLKVYAANAKSYMKQNGISTEDLARVASKNHTMAKENKVALIKKALSEQDVLKSRPLFPPLLSAMSAPMASGAAAVILCNLDFVEKHGLHDQAVEVLEQVMTSDREETFSGLSTLCGFEISQRAARTALERAGKSIDEVDVIELHDAFSSAELITYEALGLATTGKAAVELLRGGYWKENSAGGKLFHLSSGVVVNPSGGLISKGHPTGATGLAQCIEITWQLRGQAGKRQVDGASLGLQHNYGWSSSAVVTLYGKPDWYKGGGRAKL